MSPTIKRLKIKNKGIYLFAWGLEKKILQQICIFDTFMGLNKNPMGKDNMAHEDSVNVFLLSTWPCLLVIERLFRNVSIWCLSSVLKEILKE